MEIELSRGLVAVVDDGDYDRVMTGPKWCADSKGYPVRHVRDTVGNRKIERMAHAVLSLPISQKIDHRDRNPRNNRRQNLRPATTITNGQNRTRNRNKRSSLYKGIYPTKNGKWRATVTVNKKPIHLGLFLHEREAATAYDQAAKHYFREFAAVNLT